jgi:hypothetical protein
LWSRNVQSKEEQEKEDDEDDQDGGGDGGGGGGGSNGEENDEDEDEVDEGKERCKTKQMKVWRIMKNGLQSDKGAKKNLICFETDEDKENK